MRLSRDSLRNQVLAAWREARGPVALGLLVIIAWFSSLSQVAPKPVPVDAPEPIFSSGRALAHLSEIARAAHPTGSPEHTRVREYLLRQFRELGHATLVQTATAFQFSSFATVRNILVRIPGLEAGAPAVLVTAHYDSGGIAIGAADDGSGVVPILEAVRALGAGPRLRNDVIVLISDAEELGLLGARAFAEQHPWMDDVAVVLGIEMRGGAGPSMMFETGANNGWIIEAYRSAAPYPWANSISQEIYRRMRNSTDFAVFKQNGKQGLNFAGLAKPNVYHQTYDTLENLSEATLQHHGSQVLAMIRHLGNADLAFVEAPDVSYFTLPLLGLVAYGAIWNWIIGGFAAAAWVLAFVMLCRKGSAIKPVLAGVAMAAAFVGTVSWLSQLLVSWRLGAHPEAGALLAGLFHREGWYVLTIAAFAVTSVALLVALFSRWFSASGLIMAALAIPMGLAGFLTFAAPLGAMNLQWPSLAACMGALALIGARRQGLVASIRWLAILLTAVPVLLILTPLIEGIWLAMSLQLAPAIGLLVGITMLLLLPAIRMIGEGRWWWAPLLGSLAGAVFLSVGVRLATPAPDRPAPSTLIYALDRDAKLAYWLTDPWRDQADPGVVWATERVGDFGEVSSLRGFAGLFMRYRTTAAPVVEAPLPVVTLIQEGTASGDPLRLSIVSGLGAEMMIVRSEDASRILAVNGREAPSGGLQYIEHWGVTDGGMMLGFELPASGEILSFFVVEHLLRPEELLGEGSFARPRELAPNVRAFSDRAVIRTPVSVDPLSGTVRVGHAAIGFEPKAEPEAAAQPELESDKLGGSPYKQMILAPGKGVGMQ